MMKIPFNMYPGPIHTPHKMVFRRKLLIKLNSQRETDHSLPDPAGIVHDNIAAIYLRAL